MPIWVEASLGVLAAFVGACAVYVLVTYLFARRTVPRPFGETMRSAIQELACTLVGQPLVPLYLLLGYRLRRKRARAGDAPRRAPVVFVHGYTQTRANFLRISRELQRRGFIDLFGFNYPSLRSVRLNAKRLGAFVERVCKECEVEQVDLVCHSMGGLVALDYLYSEEGAKRVERCVSIASPYGGVAWRGPLLGASAVDLRKGFILPEHHAGGFGPRLLSIYSSHDNVVFPAKTSSLSAFGGRDMEIGGMGHFSILFDAKVAKAVGDFLSEESPPALRASAAVAVADDQERPAVISSEQATSSDAVAEIPE